MAKDYKKGLKKALDIIRTMPRVDLEWEWMKECDNGKYIERDDLVGKIIDELKLVEESKDIKDQNDKPTAKVRGMRK